MSATHRVLVTLIVLANVVLLAACGGAESRRASHMQRGQEFFEQGNFDKARVEFRNAMQIAPQDADAKLMAGRVAEKLGEVREAIGLYQATVDIAPEHVQGRANLGRVFVFAAAPERALEVIEPAIAKHPDDADLLTVRGAARIQLGKRMEALADAERAVQVAPQNENAVALLASLYRQGNETGRAIELVRKTVDAVPTSADLRQVLASLELAVGEKAAAEEQLRKLIEMKPDVLAYRYQLAMFQTRDRRLDDAERTLRDAIDAAPEKDEAKLAYVDFVTSQRSRAAGEKALGEFIAAKPDDYELRLGMGSLQERAGALDAAAQTYGEIIERDGDGPKGLMARNRLAAIRVSQGRFDAALKGIGEVLAENPRDNDALILRGNIALERNDPAAAVADLRAVLRDQPNAVPVRRALARAHVANGEAALAEENLRTALQSAPNDVQVRIDLAQLYGQTQRGAQAVALLEEAVKKAPQEAAAREALVRAYLATQDFDAARIAAEDLKVLRPDAAVGPYLAGLVAQAQNRQDDAGRELETALKLQPAAMDALAALTRLDVANGRQARAVERVAAVVAQDTKNSVARNLLGELHLGARQYPQAIEQLTAATLLAPKWAMPYRNLAIAKLAAKDVAAAESTYRAGIESTGYAAVLVADLAALYERQNRIDDAIAQYEALAKQHPRLEMATNNLAMLLVTYRNDRASLDRARDLTAAFAKSESSALLDTHGWVRFKRGEYHEALPPLEQAVARAPESKLIRYHLAMAQLKAGQTDKARSNLETALAGSASFTGAEEARTQLAELKARSG